MRKWLVIIAAVLLFGGFVWNAQGADTASMSAEAMKHWNNRLDMTSALKAAELFEQIAKADPKDAKMAELAVRSFYWLGINQKVKEKKQEYHKRGWDLGEMLMKTQPKNVGVIYWTASNIARYAQTLGELQQKTYFTKINPLMEKVIELDQNYFYGGGPRYLAIITIEMSPTLRKFAAMMNKKYKFTVEEAIEMCKEAIKIGNYYFLNHTTLAEAYIEAGKKDEARKELEWVIATDPGKLPECKPENIFEQGRAKEMLKNLK